MTSKIKISTTARVVIDYSLHRVKGNFVWTSLEDVINELEKIRDIDGDDKDKQNMLIEFINKLKLYGDTEYKTFDDN